MLPILWLGILSFALTTSCATSSQCKVISKWDANRSSSGKQVIIWGMREDHEAWGWESGLYGVVAPCRPSKGAFRVFRRVSLVVVRYEMLRCLAMVWFPTTDWPVEWVCRISLSFRKEVVSNNCVSIIACTHRHTHAKTAVFWGWSGAAKVLVGWWVDCWETASGVRVSLRSVWEQRRRNHSAWYVS